MQSRNDIDCIILIMIIENELVISQEKKLIYINPKTYFA